MADYLTALIDVTAAIPTQQPVPAFKAGFPVRTITVISLPAAAVGKVQLIIGANQKPITLTQQLQRFEIIGAAETEGVFLASPLGAAAAVELAAGLDVAGKTKSTVDIRP